MDPKSIVKRTLADVVVGYFGSTDAQSSDPAGPPETWTVAQLEHATAQYNSQAELSFVGGLVVGVAAPLAVVKYLIL